MEPTPGTGHPRLDEAIRELIAEAADLNDSRRDTDLLEEMLTTVVRLNADVAERGDLKLINTSLRELRDAFLLFSKYRAERKVAVFGSARLPEDDPNYQMAVSFSEEMAQRRDWMVVTGAGPGIMEASNRGAGPGRSFGVNIRLPFEDSANPFVEPDRLVNFNYFFTRKLIFVKESDAFALFPGGFGTLDETFELLTLAQTGKTSVRPIVLIEAPGTGYWQPWLDFVETSLVRQGTISPHDLNLFTYTTDPVAAADEITRFYTNYHSQRFVGDRLVLRLMRPPGDEDLAWLNDEFGDMLASGRIEAIEATEAEIADDDHVELPRLRLHFDRRSLGRLRYMVNAINDLSPGEPAPAGD
ncbi:MAG TPA: TIGR00730 family Rossman fold protein [Acidimicrobiia bacterium]|nr:TIGR00730 family Rossman fold protein [Acidimicrobiia bacterium]